jgi:hypothetical protein
MNWNGKHTATRLPQAGPVATGGVALEFAAGNNWKTAPAGTWTL